MCQSDVNGQCVCVLALFVPQDARLNFLTQSPQQQRYYYQAREFSAITLTAFPKKMFRQILLLLAFTAFCYSHEYTLSSKKSLTSARSYAVPGFIGTVQKNEKHKKTTSSPSAFLTHGSVINKNILSKPTLQATIEKTKNVSSSRNSFPTSLFMYNLPPNNGGGRDPNPLGDILPTIVTVVGLAVFFASPLGGIFFAITNSLFLLALITPVLIFAGIQIWSKLNTYEGDCPNCGNNVVVLKSKEGEPTLCLNCGSMVRATVDLKGIELCNGKSMDDNFFNTAGSNGPSFTDIFSSPNRTPEITVEEEKKKSNRDRTVIDVEVMDD